MLYFDSSVLVSLIGNEGMNSERAQAIVESHSHEMLLISTWTIAETRCAFAAKVRTKEFNVGLMRKHMKKFDAMCEECFKVVAVDDSDIVLAGELAVSEPKTPLLGADALHIAIAQREMVTGFVTLDTRQAAAAKKLLDGVRVIS